MFYKSKITGKLYPRCDYINHGKGGVYRGYKDLPIDEYPYIIIEKANPDIHKDITGLEATLTMVKMLPNIQNSKQLDGVELKYLIELMDKAPTKPTLKNRL